MKYKDVEKLLEDGLISPVQRENIIQHYHLTRQSSVRWFIFSASLLGVAFIVGGLCLLLAACWEDMSDVCKVGAGMVGLAAVWLAYFFVRGKHRLLAEGVAVLGAVVWGLNLYLHSSLYYTRIPFVEACFVFFLGIVFIPFVSKQRLLIWGVAATSVILLLHMSERGGSWLNLEFLISDGNKLAAFSLLAILWWLLGERSRKSTALSRHYYWLTVPSFIFIISFGQSILLYNMPRNMELSVPGYVMLSLAPVLCLLFKPKSSGWISWVFVAGLACAIIPLAIFTSWHQWGDWRVQKIVNASLCAGGAIILMSVGTRSNREAWINYGSLLSVFVVIGVLCNIFQSLENSGLALIISGVLLLIFVFCLDWQRRRLVHRVKTSNRPA